jgi:hypothetical protein
LPVGPAPVRCASVPRHGGSAERDDHAHRPDRVLVGACRATMGLPLFPLVVLHAERALQPGSAALMGWVRQETPGRPGGIVAPFAYCGGGKQWPIRHPRHLLGGSRRRGWIRRFGAAVRWLCWDVPIVAEGDPAVRCLEESPRSRTMWVPRPNVRSTRLIVRWAGNRRHDARPADPPPRLAPAWAAATNPSRRTVGTIATGAVQVSGTSTATSGLE